MSAIFFGDMNSSESEPDHFRSGFAVALAPEESAQACDQSQHFLELRPGRAAHFSWAVIRHAVDRNGPCAADGCQAECGQEQSSGAVF